MHTAEPIRAEGSLPARNSPSGQSRFGTHALAWLGAITLLLGVQGYLAFREPIFSPVDELQHVDYVRTVALQARLPIYGEKLTDPSLLAMDQFADPFLKSGTTLKSLPGSLRWDYEALQFPLFYIVAAPVYKLLASDERAAIYGVRLFNVMLSAALLVLLVALLRASYQVTSGRALAVALPIALIPGVALRGSQVINEVLAMVLITALLISLVKKGSTRPRLQAFIEGGLLGLALLTKLTAVAIIPALFFAFVTRRGDLRMRLLAVTGGAALSIGPWLAWALPVYGSPLPFMTRHPQIFRAVDFALPNTGLGWLSFSRQLVHYFWLPWEWRTSGGIWEALTHVGSEGASALIVVAATVSIALTLRRVVGGAARPVAIAGISLGSFAVFYLAFIFALKRVWPSDLRELYLFLGALTLLLGPAASRLSLRLVLAISGTSLVLWLVIDAGYYLAGYCRC